MILCEVNKNSLKIRTSELLTAGSREVNEVEFRFNSTWDGVTKTAVFRTEKKTVSVLLNGDKTQLPWEVLADVGEVVAVGVYGVSGETLVLPTVWGIIGKVVDAAKLGDEEKEPTPDVYQQILDKLNSMSWDTLENKPFTNIGSGLKVEDGALTATAQGGADITITDTAEVGEVLTVEEVDSEGKPTKWKTEKPTAEQKQADWEQTDTTDASYIKNKPTIPDAAQIDTTLTKSGQAADAKAVGDALAGKQAAGNYLTEESDPTVPTWAKQATKPTYTASEVGALPDTTVIPSVDGMLKFTSQSLTDSQKQQARENIGAGTSSFSGSYNDLTNKPAIPSVDWNQVTTGTNITLADRTEYRLTDVTTLTISYSTGNFECWLRLTFADSGDITVTLPESQYIGSTPTFANGETWELSIKDGVIVSARVG